MAGTTLAAVLALVLAGPPGSSTRPKAERERMKLQEVLSTAGGEFLVLLRTESEPYRFLPIAVGQSEAVMLKLRLDRRAPPRPLTLNLLDSVLAATKASVVEISIDDQRSGVFLGRIRLRQAGRVIDLDARPSDALGLAAGTAVPIFVSRRVLDGAAIDSRDLEPNHDPEGSTHATDQTL